MDGDQEELDRFMRDLAKRISSYGSFTYEDFVVDKKDQFFGYFVPQARLLGRLKLEVDQARSKYNLPLVPVDEEQDAKSAGGPTGWLKRTLSRLVLAVNRPLVNRQREFNGAVTRALVYLTDAFQLQNDELHVFYMKFNELINRLNETLVKKAESEDTLRVELRKVLEEMRELKESVGNI